MSFSFGSRPMAIASLQFKPIFYTSLTVQELATLTIWMIAHSQAPTFRPLSSRQFP